MTPRPRRWMSSCSTADDLDSVLASLAGIAKMIKEDLEEMVFFARASSSSVVACLLPYH